MESCLSASKSWFGLTSALLCSETLLLSPDATLAGASVLNPHISDILLWRHRQTRPIHYTAREVIAEHFLLLLCRGLSSTREPGGERGARCEWRLISPQSSLPPERLRMPGALDESPVPQSTSSGSALGYARESWPIRLRAFQVRG